jgi:hypothetical protein
MAKKPARKRRAKKPVRRGTSTKRKRKAPGRRKKSVVVKRKAPVKRRKRRSQGRKLVRQVERRSVERVMAGKRRKHRTRKRRVRMAGHAPRRRAVGKAGSSGLLLGLVLGAGALYLLARGSGGSATSYSSLPALTQTGNYTRDTQSQQIINYALAAGLTINAITSLINSLNSSSDNTVSSVYDKVNTTGSLNDLGLPGYDPIA